MWFRTTPHCMHANRELLPTWIDHWHPRVQKINAGSWKAEAIVGRYNALLSPWARTYSPKTGLLGADVVRIRRRATVSHSIHPVISVSVVIGHDCLSLNPPEFGGGSCDPI